MEKLGLLVEKLISYLETTEQFVAQQAPDMVKQVLEYEAFSTSAWLWFCVILVILGLSGFITLLWATPPVESMTRETRESVSILMYISIGVFIVSLFLGFANFLHLKKIEKAPKLIVVEYLKKTVSSEDK